jgi:hypothetical protein
MRHHLVPLTTPLALALALALSAPANAADTGVAELQRPSTIRSYAGIQVFSDFDGSAYRLAILRDSKLEHLPVDPSQAPFDADIGPDRKGRPQLIYTRCRTERADVSFGRNESEGCDLVTYSLAGGGERPVRGANTAAGNEFAPTLWRGRIAFARKGPGRGLPIVYTRRLGAPRSQASTPLPGISRRTRTRGILELDLSGHHLGQITFSAGQTEVRLVDVADRSVRRLARTGVGEGGQYFAGIGFTDGHLAWAAQWLTGGGAVTPGIYRYRLSNGELSRAPHPHGLWWIVGLALFDADGAYVIDAQPPADGCGDIEGEPPVLTRPCQLVRSKPLAFRPVRR